MAGRQILIDGYNVIRADPVLSAMERESLEEARVALMRRLASSPRFMSDTVTVVFDGVRRQSWVGTRRLGHVTATYSRDGSSADDVIKGRAQGRAAAQSVVVVTNDADIRAFCQGVGCTVTSSENLLAQLSSPRRLAAARRDGPRSSEGSGDRGTPKKGNPRRLPKRARNRQDYRF